MSLSQCVGLGTLCTGNLEKIKSLISNIRHKNINFSMLWWSQYILKIYSVLLYYTTILLLMKTKLKHCKWAVLAKFGPSWFYSHRWQWVIWMIWHHVNIFTAGRRQKSVAEAKKVESKSCLLALVCFFWDAAFYTNGKLQYSAVTVHVVFQLWGVFVIVDMPKDC